MKYKRRVLKNGMKVITVHMADTPTVTVLVMVEAGSKYENKSNNGISHFLEHMCFKGTTKRPNALAISKELESIGSLYNAFTTEEYTGYFAKAAPKHMSTLLDVVSDIYLNSTFPEAEIKKEKGVIIEEINMYRDLPHRHVQELFMHLLYGDQPAGWNIAGTKENVQGMRRTDFLDYHNKHYVAEATTVIVAGNFDERSVQKMIGQTFASISTGEKDKKPKVRESQKDPAFLIERRPTDQTHLVLGVRGFSISDTRAPAARVLNAVLGAGMSSRLFQKLREEMGVGYYVRSSYDTFTDHGMLSVSTGCDVKRVPEVMGAIVSELNRFKTEPVSHEELEKTQEYLIGTLSLGLESSDSIAEFYGYQEVMRRELRTPKDIAKEIKEVTPAAIRSVARQLFVDNHLNLTAVGPMPSDGEVRELLKF